jgi:hypothetical protein
MTLSRLQVAAVALLLAAPALAQGAVPTLKDHSGGTGSNIGDLSGLSVSPSGAGSYAESLASLAAQSGVLLDTFKQPGDEDDAAALTRLCENVGALQTGRRFSLRIAFVSTQMVGEYQPHDRLDGCFVVDLIC